MLYTTPIADIINSHNLHYHFYADDTQLYVTFKTDYDVDAGLSRSRVKHCVVDIDRWMTNNKLKLNENKTAAGYKLQVSITDNGHFYSIKS